MKEKVKFFDFMLIILWLSIAFSAHNILAIGRTVRVLAIGILILFLCITYCIKIEIYSKTQSWAFVFATWCLLSVLWSYNSKDSLLFALQYFSLFLLVICVQFEKKFMMQLLKCIRIISMIFALSIVLCIFYNRLIVDVFSFVLTTTADQLREISLGYFSGFAAEKAEAAYLMNIGIATCFGEIFSHNKLSKKCLLELVIYLVALMLTGKRTLFLVVVLVGTVFLLQSDMKNKWLRICQIVLIAICLFMILIKFVPQTAMLLERFSEGAEDDSFNGRVGLWEICIKYFNERKLHGWGIHSFNSIAYGEENMTYYGLPWFLNAHNIYYQMLAELGLVGVVSFLFLNIGVVCNIVNAHRKRNIYDENEKYLMYFSTYIFIMFLVYGVTGNNIYSFEMFIWYVTVIGIILNVNRIALKGKMNEEKMED